MLYNDSDGDGYGDPDTATMMCFAAPTWLSDNTDCDDTNDDVNPGATEICNEIDDDCDNLTDDADDSVTGQ